MRYRPIGQTGVEASVLGFGCMRLPIIDGRSDRIDYPAATELLHAAIEHGVNYIDTAWFYHAEQFGQPGESEPFVGQALSGGWRQRVNLATKLPQQLVKTRESMDEYLAAQLDRLQTDYLDFYLVHGVNGPAWDRMVELGVREFLDAARADGRIRFPAFSYHGTAEDFPRVVDGYDWAFAQIQFNYVDVEYQAGRAGLEYAAGKGVGVVVMEPLKGGKLARPLPDEMQAVFDATGEQRTPAEWALRYVWNEPGVSLLLSGMNASDQLDENLRLAERAHAGVLGVEDQAVYAEARRVLEARTRADCTACRYCMPCPSDVDIPAVLAALNRATMWDDPNAWMSGYVAVQGKAGQCTECGQCESMCPQGLPIPALMREAAELFGS